MENVVKDIRRHAQVFQAVIDAAEAIETIGSLENAIKERSSRVAVLDNTIIELINKQDSLKSDINSLTSDKADHLTRINNLFADAESKTQEIIQAANSKAAAIIEQANFSATGVIGDATAKADQINVSIAQAQSQLNEINATISIKLAEQVKLQDAINALKQKFQ